MALISIPVKDFNLQAYRIWADSWFLLTSGDFAKNHYNTMTIGWGSIGRMWQKPFIQVVVRPSRYTLEFMEKYDTFTVCAFPPALHDALSYLGEHSGRDGNKIAAINLTPVASSSVAAPAFAEAELVIECRKMYWQDIEPTHFLDPTIHHNYPTQDYHRIYFGEILAIRGTEEYRRAA